MALSVKELEKMMNYECSKCGCTGLHACIGRRLPPPTPEDEARLTAALEKIFGQVAKEEERL